MITLEQIVKELKAYDGEEIKIMEVCGTHTSSIFKNGKIIVLCIFLPERIRSFSIP